MTADRWFWARRPRPAASMRLVCLPYAGGSTSVFRAWPDLAPPELEVCPVELPGRGARMGEAPYRSLPPLVEALADALQPLFDRPYALFGHSMGGLVGFELARVLRRRGWPQPGHLFVSASPAPSLSHAPFPYGASDTVAKARLKALNGTPREVLENDELMELVLPVIRADFALLQTYEYREETPFEMPMTVFGGIDDRTVQPSALEGWRAQSSRVDLRLLPGDHFFVHDLAPELIGLITDRLSARTAEWPGARLECVAGRPA